MNYKKDFPIFKNNPLLIYLDSSASAQKPEVVIEGVKEYSSNLNSNVHADTYDISLKSREVYIKAKKIIAKNLGVESYKEIIFSYNSTYASNLLVSSLRKNNFLKKGDKVLITIAEHHANVVPWLILKEEIGIELDFVGIDKKYNIDLKDFEEKYDEKVKVIAFTYISNVLGQIFDLEEIGKRKRQGTLFIVDATQAVPHMKVDVKKINCDALYFTGYKVMADGGIGVLWGKSELLNSISPAFCGGGAIGEVTSNGFTHASLPDKWEPGTPNITGAVSLLKAFEYIESIGGYDVMMKYEEKLVEYFLEKFNKNPKLKMLGSIKKEKRIGVFTFIIEGHHSSDIGCLLADNNISVRAGRHCAHILYDKLNINSGIRVSLHIYNTKEDIDSFFKVINSYIDK